MKGQDRDQSMDRLLRNRAALDRTQGTGACLDADLLAAWADGCVSAVERAAAETHAADCARCQALLVAMVRTEHVVAPVEASGSRIRQWLTWLTPVAAAATAWALWVSVDQMRVPVEPRPAESIAAPPAAPPPASEPRTVPSNVTPVETESRTASTLRDAEKDVGNRSADLKATNERRRIMARDDERAAKEGAEGFRADAFKRSDSQGRGLTPAAASPPSAPVATPAPPPLPPLPRPADAPSPAVTVQAQSRLIETQNAAQNAAQNTSAQNQAQKPTQTGAQGGQVPPLPPAAQAAQASARQAGVAEQVVVKDDRQRGAGAGGGARANEAAREETLRLRELVTDGAAVLEVMSPDPSVRWRILNGLMLQRSSDGGLSWQAEKVEIIRRITAGAAPSTSVCWLVGQNGLVMLTTDGRTWQQIAFPQFTALKDVRATDARTATITTADGRVFVTENGGKTWSSK
jgi:Photosynthesis system II assembly factor YCF48